MVLAERCLILFGFFDFNLPVAAIGAQRGEDGGVS